ncbi:MAG TPA: hypothetical protein VG714_05595 [Acidobacteriaceae bacterium]|nr:hypothetical protein [Acidobacteriaceae bacterium]
MAVLTGPALAALAQNETAPTVQHAGAGGDEAAPLPESSSPTGQGGAAFRDLGASGPPATRRQQRTAEKAYFSGAKKLEHQDLKGAEREFTRARDLDPANRAYAIALSVARQSQIATLMQQVQRSREAGDETKAQALLSEARSIDPTSPLVMEHSEPTMSQAQGKPGGTVVATLDAAGSQAERARLIAAGQTSTPWRIEQDLSEPIEVKPTAGTQTFDLSGDSTEVIRRALAAYGIRTVIDNSVVHKNLRFNLSNVDYRQAITALTTMADVFVTPVDERTVIVANDDDAERKKLDRLVEETIFVPGATNEQINELVQVLKQVFEVTQVTPQLTLGAIVVRASQDVLAPINRTLQGLMDPMGEVVIEVRLYEVDTSKMVNAGANLPTQFGVYNVDQAASDLVKQNSSLVQQAIAQGLISPDASNFEIAAALIGSGLVSSSLLNSTIGIFGGGLMQTGITETGNVTINLGLNSSTTRTLDDIQLRVGDGQPAKFREGTRYPITTATYTTGLTGAASQLGNATINGVNVSSLLSQYSAAAGASIPQVSYEDLGVTLEAKPSIQKSGRISLDLKLKIEALAGSSLNGIPVLQSREFNSNLTVGEGQSALLASHVSRSEVNAMTGIPGLSSLPGFQLPTTKNTDHQSTELVVVITPHVVRWRSGAMAGPRMLVPAQLASE